MICRSCSEGSDQYRDDPGGVMWNAFHGKCKGETHCDCQHVPIPRVRPLKTSGGVEMTPELLHALAAEAEAGYDVESLLERQREELG